jgi:hypothetical protein
MIEMDGKITTHCQTIAEKLNNYYVSVADKYKYNITNHNLINNINKSCGYDE